MNWLRKLLSFGSASVDPGQVLANAIREIASEELSHQALEFFGNQASFSEYVYSHNDETSYDAEAREPSKPELAFEIFFHLLMNNGYLIQIDWAAGPDDIIESFNALFEKSKAQQFSEAEVQTVYSMTEGLGRGDSYMKLLPFLEKASELRGRKLAHMDLGHDAFYPIPLSCEAHDNWSASKFGRSHPLFP